MGFPHRGDKNKLCHLKQKGSSVRFCPHWSPPGASGDVQRFSALQMHLWTQSWWHLCKKRYIKHSLPCFFYLLHRRGQHSWSFTLYCHKHFRFCFCPVSFPQPCIHVALEVPWVFPLSITGLLLLQVFNPAGLLRLFTHHFHRNIYIATTLSRFSELLTGNFWRLSVLQVYGEMNSVG